MSRRWFRSSRPSAVSPDSPATALTTALVGDLSRRLFGKRLLVAIPVAAAAVIADLPEAAEAAPVANWTLSGNAIPDATKYIGTTNTQPLIIKTNNTEQVRVQPFGMVGIGTSVPQAQLHVTTTDITGSHTGIYGETSSGESDAVGVLGELKATTTGPFSAGVRGVSYGQWNSYGVYGVHTRDGTGVYGKGNTGVQASASGWWPIGIAAVAAGAATPWAIYGLANATDGGSAYAGYFQGRVHVSGTLTKTAGTFKIDHPLDPANKYLSHSFVESPDMLNVYDGNVTTNANGDATVTLPAYFEALNRDFRYQLTVIGQFAQAIVASKIKANQFTIKTDKPNVEVSWQVTGIRQDAWAKAHPIQVEEDKPAEERGTYLTPKEHGQPESKRNNYERVQRLIGKDPK